MGDIVKEGVRETIVAPCCHLWNSQDCGLKTLQSKLPGIIPGQSLAFLPGTGKAYVPVLFSAPEVAKAPDVDANQLADSWDIIT